jgi:glycosyltransferase involved in cell wall biosynthesis
MRIGIDMLGVQSQEGRRRESGRYGRQLVSALLAGEPVHRFTLYSHQGFPTDRIPSAGHARRVSLAPKTGGSARLRPTIQAVLDQNPDRLDWLILLDPFEPNYGGIPPESPLNDLKVASMIVDLGSTFADDRRLAPLRRHDAILAVSEATASDCRNRLGTASGRVTALGIAAEAAPRSSDTSEPLTRLEADELGRMGIAGPFLLANMARSGDRANLSVILDVRQRLPIEVRQAHQLVIAGPVDDPWGAVCYLHDHGCGEGLVLVGEVEERTLGLLYDRCTAFVSPSIEEGSGLSIVEAMSRGVVVVAGGTGAQLEIVGDAGLLVDPSNPAEVAEQLMGLLSDADRLRDLREQASVRSSRFAWGPVVEALNDRLAATDPTPASARFRVDRAHYVRPRIALFPDVPQGDSARLDLERLVPEEWRKAYNIDLYLEPGDSALIDRIPADFGGFDARQFDRNDEILSYHAVVYDFNDLESLELKLGRLRSRPGLILLPEQVEFPPESASGWLREIFLTSSRVVVRSIRQFDRIKASLPDHLDQLVVIPPGSNYPPGLLREQIERCAAELGRRSGSLHRPIAGSSRGSAKSSRTRTRATKSDVSIP